VNDCTPDASMAIVSEILREYPNRQDAVQYVHQHVNTGLPAARNAGLAVAVGKYIFHCDSDDWVEPDMMECMYKCAELNGADIVYSDWYLSFMKKERLMREPVFFKASECLKAILCGKMKYNVWNKLVKRKLYTDNGILFPDGLNMGEDMTMIKLFCHAGKVTHVDAAFYHYVQVNANAYTKNISTSSLQQVYDNATIVINYIKRMYDDRFSSELQSFKLSVKLPLLISAQREYYETWLTWFPEANLYIGLSGSSRMRFIQHAALTRKFWILRLHYYGIMKLMYGIIYR